MKLSIFLKLVLLTLVCVVPMTGCKKKPKNPTSFPNRGMTGPNNPDTDRTLLVPPVGTPDGNPIGFNQLPDRFDPNNFDRDEAQFKANTVYFDLDRSTVKTSERTKLEEVATFLKGSQRDRLEIEGHCDERGTEEYNRSLGERRAIALREYLVNLGVSGERVTTKSWGEDRPAVPGGGEAAWSKNRRGEFILLKPKL